MYIWRLLSFHCQRFGDALAVCGLADSPLVHCASVLLSVCLSALVRPLFLSPPPLGRSLGQGARRSTAPMPYTEPGLWMPERAKSGASCNRLKSGEQASAIG